MQRKTHSYKSWRLYTVIVCMGLLLCALLIRLVYLGVWQRFFIGAE